MFKLTLVTPEKRVVISQEILEATVPAHKGELNILPGHAPLITTLVPGVMKYKLKTGGELKASISWGYCNVSPEGLNILAETVETAQEIDFATSKSEIVKIESRLLLETLDEETYRHLQEKLAHEKARQILEKY
jgi:F-type H+-transporting ATPase subunit epsilon